MKEMMILKTEEFNHDVIYEISRKFRNAIENVKSSAELSDFSYIKHFPHGCCGVVSLMLGAYLHSLGLNEHKYIYGERNGFSHAWLEYKAMVIDITSDQFEDGREIYVGLKNDFYYSFQRQKGHAWNDSLDGKCIELDRLYPLYKRILNKIS